MSTNFNRNQLERVFALDLRSLAVFRIAVGVLILADLLMRWPILVAMYTGKGLFNQPLSYQYYESVLGPGWEQCVWSLYWLSDSPLFANALFVTAAVAAILLIVGKWTRLATAASWLLLASLHARNPLVTSSGDFAFKMMLFWSIFLPLGARWSFDARRRLATETSTADAVVSVATVAYIFQLFAIYFFPGIAKWNDVWFSGDAMSYVLRLNIYITDFGRQLLGHPELLTWISWATLAAEVIGIWTLFSPWQNDWFRMINLSLFWLFHLGIALSMSIGLFPWICMVAWLPIIPSSLWKRPVSEPAFQSFFNWNLLSVPRLAVEMFCLAALLLTVICNLSNTDHPWTRAWRTPLVTQLTYQLGINQHFQMFGIPPQDNPWFVYAAQLADGSQVDIFRDAQIDLKRPEQVQLVYPQFHWRKLHRNAVQPRNAFIREPLLDYAVRQWNTTHPLEKQVARARLICFKERVGPDYNAENFHSVVWGSYMDASQGPGSLFEAVANEVSDDSLSP